MNAQPVSGTCNAKDCSEAATALCERCGQSFCSAHLGQVVLHRREERSAQSTRQSALERLPTRTETYALCAACQSKPVPRKMQPLAT